MNKTHGLITIVMLLCAARVRAEEPTRVESSNLAIKLKLGINQTVDAISSATVVQAGPPLSETTGSGSRVSYGLEAQYTVSLSRYVAMGASLGYLSWRGARSVWVGPRNWVLDVAVLPEGRLKVADSVLLYVTAPIGLSLDVINELGSAAEDGPSNPALGYQIGGLVGARVHISSSIGLVAELGYIYRSFSHELSGIAFTGVGAPTSERGDITIAFGQLTMNLGMCVFF